MLKIYGVQEVHEDCAYIIKYFQTKTSAAKYCKELYDPENPEFNYFVVEILVYD